MVILGGDQPCTRRVTGVSTCPQVGSMFNEGIWNAQKKTWEGSAIRRTMVGDEANYTAFLLGTPSLQAAGCSTQRILKLPCAWVILCILHLTMDMGRLLGFVLDGQDLGSSEDSGRVPGHRCSSKGKTPVESPMVRRRTPPGRRPLHDMQ